MTSIKRALNAVTYARRMKPETRPSNVTYLNCADPYHAEQDYELIIRKLKTTPLSGLCLSVSLPRFDQFNAHLEPICECLVSEIGLWSQTLGQQNVQAIELHQPFAKLEPFEVTQLMHLVASKFSLGKSAQNMHLAITALDEVNHNHLALLKGLDFTYYQIQLANPDELALEILEKKIELIREYQFKCVGVQLIHTDCLADMRSLIQAINNSCGPDYICLGPAQDQFDVTTSRIREDYLAVRSDLDIVELGVGASSRLGNWQLKSYSDPTRYKTSLQKQQLPLHRQMKEF